MTFSKVTINKSDPDVNVITWVLSEHTRYNISGFKIYGLRRRGDSLKYIGSTTEFYFNDSSSDLTKTYSLLNGGGYVVRLVKEDGETIDSDFTAIPSSWDSRTVQVATELCSRERRAYDNGASGAGFYLLHRKHWGEDCSECVDQITKEVTNPLCTTCYGTGRTGGYYTPISAKGLLGGTRADTTERGDQIEETVVIRSCDVPLVTPYDIIVLPELGKRCKVLTVDPIVQVRGADIVYNMVSRVMKPEHIIYQLVIDEHTVEEDPLTQWSGDGVDQWVGIEG